MFCKSFGIARATALPLCLMLSACGGDGATTVASIPPPPPTPAPTPTPTPTPAPLSALDVQLTWLPSPATRQGDYDTIGRLSLTPANGVTTSRVVMPGEMTMSSGKYFSDDPFVYSLSTFTGIFPNGWTAITVDRPFLSWSFMTPASASIPYANEPRGSYCCQDLGQHMVVRDTTGKQVLAYDLTNGFSNRQLSAAPTNVKVGLVYDIGYSYVAMGEWSWGVVDLKGAPAGDSGRLLFVDGDRTPSPGIPASGTATYDARSLLLRGSLNDAGVRFTLTADFGGRTISTLMSQNYAYDPDIQDGLGPVQGIHVTGSAPFANDGLFNIPLAGTANYSATNVQTVPAAESVTGLMNGAFFGPAAEQVGGTFALSRSDGVQLLQDAFVGQQRKP